MKGPSPLLGYNTNVRHAGKLFHIQTEDSGLKHPHIITHLFADGGRIIASKKTTYAEFISDPDVHGRVKKMMRDQHKGMFIELRDGAYDEEVHVEKATSERARASDAEKAAPIATGTEVDALERAAARLAQSASSRPPSKAPGRFQATKPAQLSGQSANPPASIFGSDLLSEKSLDEVILSYLAEDLEEDAS